MEVITKVKQMHNIAEKARLDGKKIALIPTMGFLHEGHLTLVRRAGEEADVLVVSIFVNPTQFAPGEDFEQYPRDLQRDLDLLEPIGVDYVYHPEVEEVYPEGYQTYVEVTEITQYLCGESRPSHFRGVSTVCTKLFNAVKPHKAFFGEKDFQQVKVIERTVKDLNLDLEVIPVETVREPDGLAMSSRNKYLSDKEREQGLSLKRSMDKALEMYRAGEQDAGKIKAEVEAIITSQPDARIDYVSIADQDTMQDVTTVNDNSFIALAVKIGKTRLIDNSKF